MKKLAIISTHPIQYNAPLFKLLAQRNKIAIKVFYTWGEAVLEKKYDPGFGKVIEWDIPLLQGYDYDFVENVSNEKGSHQFSGIDNPGLIEKVTHWNADAILVYGWGFKSHLKCLRHFKNKIPVLFRGDSINLGKPKGIKSVIRQLFLKWVYHYVDLAFYVGSHNKTYFLQSGLKESQLRFAPHAIENERFFVEAKNDTLPDLREKFAIEPDAILFLYAGKLDDNKNTAFLAGAVRSVDSDKLHLIIAGDGAKKEFLENEFGTATNIHFLPFQNQSMMPWLYQSCDVFVLPSLSETWGLSINEAMASGKAVLVSDTCGAAIDLVQNGKNGWMFINGDAQDLQQKLGWFVDNQKYLREMGARSREIIENWSFGNVAEVIEQTVNEIG